MTMSLKYTIAAVALLVSLSSAYGKVWEKHKLPNETQRHILQFCVNEGVHNGSAEAWMKDFMHCAKEKGAVVKIFPVKEKKKHEMEEKYDKK